jgi:hypothetical protein
MSHYIDHGNEDHAFTAFGQCLVVLRQSAVFAEPREGTFHDPALRQHHELAYGRTLHDLHEATEPTTDPVHELPSIAPIRENQLQSSEPGAQLLDQELAAVAVLDVGGMYDQGDDQAERVHDQMTFAAFDLLARVVPPRPPFSAVLTDWLSMMPTEGVGVLPARRRTCPRRRS